MKHSVEPTPGAFHSVRLDGTKVRKTINQGSPDAAAAGQKPHVSCAVYGDLYFSLATSNYLFKRRYCVHPSCF